MKKNLLLPLLIMVLLFARCEDEIVKTLILLDYVELDAGTDATLNIDAGNPPYHVTSSDNAIATATVDGSKLTIKGHKEGKTTLLLTDNKKQSKNIQVKVGVSPIEFTKQYSPETGQTVLSDFGISWEEAGELGILIKPAGANKLMYLKTYEWPIFTSEEIKKNITDADGILVIGDEGITLKANKEELYHHYFGVNYNGDYYLFHISNVNEVPNSEGKVLTTVTGEYKKA